MNELKSTRHTIKYNDNDQITDTVIGANNDEYIVTMSGKDWRNYDFVLEHQEESARRMADYSHFIHLQYKDECTHAMVLARSAATFVELRNNRRGNEIEEIDPKFGTSGSA